MAKLFNLARMTVSGTPGTGNITLNAEDRWGCAVGWLPMLLIEGAQQTRQAGAAIESFRNEMVQGQAAFVEVIEQRRRQVANSG
jgi:hypothetical protein